MRDFDLCDTTVAKILFLFLYRQTREAINVFFLVTLSRFFDISLLESQYKNLCSFNNSRIPNPNFIS